MWRQKAIPQGCNNYPPIQTEREYLSRWQLSGHLFIVSCWEDPCKSPWTPWTVRTSIRKPMWIQKGQRNNWHDLHSKTASREMPGTECWTVRNRCPPYQNIWHSQSWGTLAIVGKQIMPFSGPCYLTRCDLRKGNNLFSNNFNSCNFCL